MLSPCGILDNPVPDPQLFVTDSELVEVRGGAELPQLELVAYSFAVTLVDQELAVVVIEEGGGAGGSLRLDNAASRITVEEVLLARCQNFGLIEIAWSDFPS